ncbi:MAG: hypothetical protein Q8S54_04515 [Bacteroidota bacterium]|nr:hypothetical protein [Odoribacter sp.]MDP3642437.1 hypothetical protein [Bacteroidota bacterium]
MRRISNTTLLYVVALLVIVVAFLLLGGASWAKGMFHGNKMMSMDNLNWVQILISLAIGFVLGLFYSRRRW